MKNYLLIFLLIFPSLSFSKDNNNLFTNNKISKYNNFIYDYINHVNITYSHGYNNQSLSNGNSDTCNIKILYSKENPILIKSSSSLDLEFTILHEVSHCVLERKIMYKNIKWVDKSPDNLLVDNYILKAENQYLYKKLKFPPMLTYHEIYADTLASMLFIKFNSNSYKQYINEVRQKRIFDYNDISNYYITDKAIEDVLLLPKEKIDNMSNEEIYNTALKITQINFKIYIKGKLKNEN